jgi:ubiquinone biosynthesis protein Coq4
MYKLFVRFRAAVLVLLTHSLALPLLKLVRRPEKFPYTPQALEALPPGTLGNDMVHYLHRKKLPLLPYYARHDMKHILLQYDTTGEGEVCLQCFMLGNGHLSFPVLATVLYGLVTMPEHYGLFRAARQRGKKCKPLEHINWWGLPPHNTQQLIQTIENNESITV